VRAGVGVGLGAVALASNLQRRMVARTTRTMAYEVTVAKMEIAGGERM
jgi:hypothetical protein